MNRQATPLETSRRLRFDAPYVPIILGSIGLAWMVAALILAFLVGTWLMIAALVISLRSRRSRSSTSTTWPCSSTAR